MSFLVVTGRLGSDGEKLYSVREFKDDGSKWRYRAENFDGVDGWRGLIAKKPSRWIKVEQFSIAKGVWDALRATAALR